MITACLYPHVLVFNLVIMDIFNYWWPPFFGRTLLATFTNSVSLEFSLVWYTCILVVTQILKWNDITISLFASIKHIKRYVMCNYYLLIYYRHCSLNMSTVYIIWCALWSFWCHGTCFYESSLNALFAPLSYQFIIKLK